MAYVLGVDVGTTFTAAATWRRRYGRADVVALGDRASVIPSAVFLRPDGEWLVGEAAKRRAVGEPQRVASGFKRRIGDPVPVLVGGRPFAPEILFGV
ncbi:MAG TPA: Hsp70 family protein, partial [Actinomycetota bacterium]|nr:Hsp70 family protein [Actinomycetota bacterium]